MEMLGELILDVLLIIFVLFLICIAAVALLSIYAVSKKHVYKYVERWLKWFENKTS